MKRGLKFESVLAPYKLFSAFFWQKIHLRRLSRISGLEAFIKLLGLNGNKKEGSNQFFYIEEKRRFELEQQLVKHWPHEMISNAFIRRKGP